MSQTHNLSAYQKLCGGLYRRLQEEIVAGVVATLGAIMFAIPLLSLGGKYLRMYTKSFSINLGYDFSSDKEKSSGNDRKPIV